MGEIKELENGRARGKIITVFHSQEMSSVSPGLGFSWCTVLLSGLPSRHSELREQVNYFMLVKEMHTMILCLMEKVGTLPAFYEYRELHFRI